MISLSNNLNNYISDNKLKHSIIQQLKKEKKKKERKRLLTNTF